MTYIKIKVKHLLIIAAVIMAATVGVLAFQGQIQYIMGRFSEIAGYATRANVYYDRAVQLDPSSPTAIIAAQRKLEQLIDSKDFGYLKKLSLTSGTIMLDSSYISAESADRINMQYKEIADHAKRDDTLAEYTIYVSQVNYFAGYTDNAVDLLNNINYVKDQNLRVIGELNLAAIYLGLGDMEQAKVVLEKNMEEKDKYLAIRQELYAYYCFMTGDYEGYKEAKTDSKSWYDAERRISSLLLKPLLRMNRSLPEFGILPEEKAGLMQNGNAFTGKVSIDGKPAPYVTVFLKDIEYRNRSSSVMGEHDGIRGVAITNPDGSFCIENVPNGIYGIGVSVDWQRIQGRALKMDRSYSLRFTGNTNIGKEISFEDINELVEVEDIGGGKLRFSVQMPEEADTYAVMMGELRDIEGDRLISNNRFSSDPIDTPEYVLDIAEERYRGMNTGASFGTDGIDPYYLLEPFYHTGEYAYYVTFYDERGDILYDSDGVYPNRHKGVVRITGQAFSKADRLLLDEKYDEAIKLFEAQLAEGGFSEGKVAGRELDEGEFSKVLLSEGTQKLHALKVLAKLYYNGWEYDEESCSLKNKNPEKATRYFEMLKEKIKDNEQINSSLAWLYIGSGKLQEGLELLLESNDPYASYQVARVYGYMGDFSKATEYYGRFNEATGHGADMLMAQYILQNQRELLVETAQSYRDNGAFYANYKPLIREYLGMDVSSYSEFFSAVEGNRPGEAAQVLEGRNDDLALLYKGLLLLQKQMPDYKEREEQYKVFYDAVKNPAIRQLLEYFGKAGIQSGFGDY